MADTWPVGDAMERGTGAGGLMAFARGFANAVGAGASNGFGLGDASSGMAGGAGQGSQIRQGFADRIKTGAQDAVLSQYPGRGVLWEYGADGVQVLPLGYAAGAAAVLVLLLVLGVL